MVTENKGQGGAQVSQVKWDGRQSHTGTTGQAVDKGHMGIMGWVALTMEEGTVGHSNK